MKKLVGLIMCFVLVVFSIIPVVAVTINGKDYGMGLIPESWEDIINDDSENVLSAFATLRTGDVNGDGKVSAMDARRCLQLVAENKLYIEVKQKSAADINGDGTISALDARRVLQAASGMTTIDTAVTTDLNWGVIIGPLQMPGGTQYAWKCEINADGLSVNQKFFIVSNDPEIIGGPVNQYFIFTPEKTGTYTISFELSNIKQTDVLDEFNVILTVTE